MSERTTQIFAKVYRAQIRRQLHYDDPMPVKCLRIGLPQYRNLESEVQWTANAEVALAGKCHGVPFYVDERWNGFEIEYIEAGPAREMEIAQICSETGIRARAI